MAVDLDAVDRALAAPHVIELAADGWTLLHPLTCRPNLFDCDVNRAAERADLAGALAAGEQEPGRFEVEVNGFGVLLVGQPVEGDLREPIDVAAMAAELRELRGRYGKDGEVWCGARRDQAGTAYCVEMAGHERDGYPHMWSEARR